MPRVTPRGGALRLKQGVDGPLAGKSALNRLELGGAELSRYHRMAWDAAKIEALFALFARPRFPFSRTHDGAAKRN
jgi:hypothetical protein